MNFFKFFLQASALVSLTSFLSLLLFISDANGSQTRQTESGTPEARRSFVGLVDSIVERASALQSHRAFDDYYSDRKLSRNLFWTPTVSASVGKQKTSNIFSGSTTESESDYWSLGAKLNLFEGGASYFNKKSADADFKNQSAERASKIQELEKAASLLVFQIIALNQQSEIIERLIEIKRESLRVVKERFQKGQIPSQEVTKAEVDLSQTESQYRDKKLKVIEAQVDFKDLSSGADVGGTTWPFSGEEKVPSARSLDSHPKVLTAQSKLDAKEYSFLESKAAFSPSLDLSYTYQESPLSGEKSRQTVAGILLTIPLWSKWETMTAKSLAFGTYQDMKIQLEQTKREIQNRLSVSSQKLELQRQNLKEASENLLKSKGLYSDILKNFRFGRISVNELFQEQTRLLDVELNYLSQIRNFHVSLVEACLLEFDHISSCF